MLAPHWVQPRIGPLLRGGIDLKAYHRQILLMGLFRDADNYISGAKRLFVESIMNRIDEPDIHEIMRGDQPMIKNRIITFKGDNGRFQYLNGLSDYFLMELRRITAKKWINFVDNFGDVPIGINVRLGNDFIQAQSSSDFYSKEAVKTPVKWFVDSLNIIRECIGAPVKAIVVSDGDNAALESLLNLENVHFLRPGCAISDLLLLAKSKILIRSGGSSFSAWASYLGQMPTISVDGQSLKRFNLVNKHDNYIDGFDPVNPSQDFLSQAKASLQPYLARG